MKQERDKAVNIDEKVTVEHKEENIRDMKDELEDYIEDQGIYIRQ